MAVLHREIEMREENLSVILANLKPKEYKRFLAASIGYSGATGVDASPERYGGLAPYIATSYSGLRQALRAMRWRRFTVTVHAGQWIIQKCAHAPEAR
jgi:hypothetical protein